MVETCAIENVLKKTQFFEKDLPKILRFMNPDDSWVEWQRQKWDDYVEAKREFETFKSNMKNKTYEIKLPLENHREQMKKLNLAKLNYVLAKKKLRATDKEENGWKQLALHYIEHDHLFYQVDTAREAERKEWIKKVKAYYQNIGQAALIDIIKFYLEQNDIRDSDEKIIGFLETTKLGEIRKLCEKLRIKNNNNLQTLKTSIASGRQLLRKGNGLIDEDGNPSCKIDKINFALDTFHYSQNPVMRERVEGLKS